MQVKNAVILEYDTNRYPFEKVLALTVFKVPALNRLHVSYQERIIHHDLTYDDNLKLRNKMQQLKDDSLFYKLYHLWVAEVLSPHYGGHITYSAHPKMRVHLSGTDSVSNFHRDVDVTKRQEQINCYLPFTDVFDTNSIWCETDYNLKNYQPVNLKYGQALLWDGGYLSHGTIRNVTGFTRVSCDFRFQAKFPERVRPPWSVILSGRLENMVPGNSSERTGNAMEC
jgi:hypothetical protein